MSGVIVNLRQPSGRRDQSLEPSLGPSGVGDTHIGSYMQKSFGLLLRPVDRIMIIYIYIMDQTTLGLLRPLYYGPYKTGSGFGI